MLKLPSNIQKHSLDLIADIHSFNDNGDIPAFEPSISIDEITKEIAFEGSLRRTYQC